MYTDIHIYIYTHRYIHRYTYTCIYMYINPYIHIPVYVCTKLVSSLIEATCRGVARYVLDSKAVLDRTQVHFDAEHAESLTKLLGKLSGLRISLGYPQLVLD